MDRCSVFKLPVKCYPRYEYFHSCLLNVTERVKDVIGKGEVIKCISHGDGLLKDISGGVADLKFPLQVTVFGDFGNLHKKEMVKNARPLQNPRLSSVQVSDRNTVLGGVWTKDKPHVLIIYLHLAEGNWRQRLGATEDLFHSLTEIQKESLVICIKGDQVLDNRYRQSLEIYQAYKLCLPSRGEETLCDAIQYVLETKVVRNLEKVLHLVKQFIPQRIGSYIEPEMSVLGEVSSVIRTVINDKGMLQDLLNMENYKPATSGIIAMETGETSSFDSVSSQSPESDLVAMETVIPDLSTSGNTSFNTDVTVPKLLSERSSVRDYNFKQRLCQQIYLPVCDVVIRQLSVRLQLSQSFVHSCLDLHRFKEHFLHEADITCLPGKSTAESTQNLEKSSKPNVKTQKGEKTVTKISDTQRHSEYTFLQSIMDVLHQAEDFVKRKSTTVNILRKIKYEVSGLLRETKVPIVEQLDMKPALPPGLQDELLSIPNVIGCGHFHGNLVIHVTGEERLQTTDKIKEAIQKKHYYHHYDIKKTVDEIQPQANIQYEVGKRIRGKSKLSVSDGESSDDQTHTESPHKYGTLGAFVYCEGAIFGLTCAHVLKDCEEKVELQLHARKFIDFGRFEPRFSMQDENRVDIAALKIVDTAKDNCITHLKDKDGFTYESILYKNDPSDIEQLEAKQVFKWGAVSDYTSGIIVSTDYKKKCIKEANITGNEKFDDDFTVIVEPLPGSTKAFSLDGDSGATVSSVELDNGKILAVGMVTAAAFSAENGEKKYHYSFVSLLYKSLQCLSEKSGCLFEWPNFT